MCAAVRLSVVIPTLNEAEHLPALLEDLRAQTLELEIVVADGGSQDGTCAEVERHGAVLVRSARGRGLQMNVGAARSRGEVLLFLHADSRLLNPTQLEAALAVFEGERTSSSGLVAGHFALRFDRLGPAADTLFRFMEAKTRTGRRGTINGDQGLMLLRADFEALGGFDTRLPFLEDQRIAAQIFSAGRWVLLPGELRTSARRFEAEGHRRRYALMALMMAMHELGIEEFFRVAPQVYASQGSAHALRLEPFLQLARQLLREDLRRDSGTFRRLGRYVRANAWQLGLMIDIARDDPDGTWLDRVDRRVSPLLERPGLGLVSDLLAAGLAVGLTLGLAPRVERLAWRYSARLRGSKPA